MKKTLLFCAFILTSCSGGGGGESVSTACNAFKVFNGVECVSDNIPVVQILIDGQTGCTGTIITNDHVLTASHCVLIGHNVVILHDHGQQTATVGVPNPLSSLSPNFDIGILTVLNVAQNLNVVPARFNLSTQLQVGDKIKVIGYGSDGTPSLANGNPRAIELQVNTINDQGIFALFDENNSGTCFGDSGGAATLDGKIVASVQGGGNNCAQGNFNTFANLQINGNVDFIKQYAPDSIFE